MPSSLTRVLPFAFVFSTRLPVSVFGTGDCFHHIQGFSRPQVLPTSSYYRTASRSLTAYHRNPLSGWASPWSSLHAPTTSTGIFTCYPSPTPLGLGLGPTNPTWTDLPSETLGFRRTWFSHVSRYSCQHSHFCPLQQPLPGRLRRKQNAPLPLAMLIPSFGA